MTELGRASEAQDMIENIFCHCSAWAQVEAKILVLRFGPQMKAKVAIQNQNKKEKKKELSFQAEHNSILV